MRSSESSGCTSCPRRAIVLGALTFSLAVGTVFAEKAPLPRLDAPGTAAKAASPAATPTVGITDVGKAAAEAAKMRNRLPAGPVVVPEGPGPANDECLGRVAIPCNSSATTDNTLATDALTDITATEAACWLGTGQTGSVWFSFTASDTSATIDTEASLGVDSSFVVLAVDQAAPCDDTLWTVFACSEDEGTGFLGNISFGGLTVGNEYVIQLDSWDAAALGSFTVNVTCPAVGAGACGDAVCGTFEDACNCPADCGAPAVDETGLCADGLDNDCDGLIDCADTDCAGISANCLCPATTCATAGCDCDVHQMNGQGACDSDGTTACDVNADTCATDTGVPGDFCQDIQNMVACAATGVGTTENWWGRCMNAATEGYDDTSNITLNSVDWGVLTMTRDTALDAEVNVYLVTTCPPDFTTASLLYTQIETIPALAANLHVTTVFTTPPVIPAGASFVVEVGTPEDGTLSAVGWTFRAAAQDVVANGAASECSDSYIRTAGSCGLAAWSGFDDIGFSGLHAILNVHSVCGGIPIECGNTFCEPPIEDQCNCPADCGTPPVDETPGVDCVDGLDNDCDGVIDCDEPACLADALCPDNNFCAGAIPAVEGCNTFTNVNATTDGPSCTSPITGDTQFGSDLWYTYTATCTGSVEVSLCDTNGCGQATDYDAAVAVLTDTGICPPALLDVIGCDDDSCGAVGGPPIVFADVTVGDPVLIQVGGFAGGQGVGSFSVACVLPGACCDDATDICTDGVTAAACASQGGRFSAGTLCADQVPPCGARACCLPDGTCADILPADCVAQSGAVHDNSNCTDGLLLCNVTASCDFNNGSPGTTGNAFASQLDLSADGFVAEAVDNLEFRSDTGDGTASCKLEEIKYWGSHDNFTAYGCAGSGVECDPLDQTACGGVPANCQNGGLDLCEDGLCSTSAVACRVGGIACPVPGESCTPTNPSCTKTPDDYTSIRVTLYNDGEDPGVVKSQKSLPCNAAISRGFSPTACLVDADCLVPGQICVDTDGNGAADTCGVTCDIIYTDADPLATVVDLDIDLLIEHTFQGDLHVSLEHLNTGTSVTLINRPGQTACGVFGYGSDNFGDPVTQADADKLILSDEAPVSIDTYNDALDPTCAQAPSGVADYAGPAAPTGSLSAFDGELKDGTWRITVTDHFAGDSGTLINWSLHFNNVVPVPPGPTGLPFTPFVAQVCTVDADCITAGCPAGTTCIAGACDFGGLPCGALGAPDGTHTGTVKTELVVSTWTWVPFEQPVGTVIDGAFEITMPFDGVTTEIFQDKKDWLSIAPELAFGNGWYQTRWMESANSDGSAAQRVFELLGIFPWQPVPTGGDLAFTITATKGGGPGPCTIADDCADLDGDGTTDDVCIFWECIAGSCVSTNLIAPSDMGSAFGACPPDNFCNLADALHALTCFAGTNPCDAINIDAGGAFGSCTPDGFCNLADALHALTCFAGTNPCVCGPSPESNGPNVAGRASLSAVASSRSIKAGAEVQVSVFVNEALDNLLGYQLQTAVSGGRNGALELVDISIDGRFDAAYAGASDPFEAFNVERGAMLAGNFAGPVSTNAHGYLATFTYRASADAVGTFVVDVLHGGADQTMLVGAEQTDKIEVSGTSPAVIVVTSGSARSIR